MSWKMEKNEEITVGLLYGIRERCPENNRFHIYMVERRNGRSFRVCVFYMELNFRELVEKNK